MYIKISPNSYLCIHTLYTFLLTCEGNSLLFIPAMTRRIYQTLLLAVVYKTNFGYLKALNFEALYGI